MQSLAALYHLRSCITSSLAVLYHLRFSVMASNSLPEMRPSPSLSACSPAGTGRTGAVCVRVWQLWYAGAVQLEGGGCVCACGNHCPVAHAACLCRFSPDWCAPPRLTHTHLDLPPPPMGHPCLLLSFYPMP